MTARATLVFDMGPCQFIRIQFRRIRRKDEEFNALGVFLDEAFDQPRLVRGVSIHDQEDLTVHARDQALEEIPEHNANPSNATATNLKGDWLTGGLGHDIVIGTNNNDALFGGGDADVLVGGAGDDDLNGDDNYIVSNGNWLNAGLNALPVNRTAGSTISYASYTITVTDSATLVGGPDQLYGGGGEDRLLGLRGNDYLDGGLGRDILIGGADNDQQAA